MISSESLPLVVVSGFSEYWWTTLNATEELCMVDLWQMAVGSRYVTTIRT